MKMKYAMIVYIMEKTHVKTQSMINIIRHVDGLKEDKKEASIAFFFSHFYTQKA